MAEYSFTPQFANLSGLAPLTAIDVTRGGELQFQPLGAIEVPSARPELVGQGMANALQSISEGLFGGISAKYAEEKALEKEEREHQRALEIYGAKKQSENKEFFERQRAAFIAENSQKIDFPEKLKAFDDAYSGFADRVPDVTPKKKKETAPPPIETVEVALPTKQDFVSDQPEVAAVVRGEPSVVTQPPIQAAPLGEIAVPEPLAKPQPSPLGGLVPAQPADPAAPRNVPTQEFADISQAEQIASQIDATSPFWKVVVKTNPRTDGAYLVAEETTADVKKQKREERAEARQEEELALKKEEAERKKAESQQQMEIRQQKVKDENKVLADHVETAATSLRELNEVISMIEKNPWSVGKMSVLVAATPMIDTVASRVRSRLETVGSDIAINAITAMRRASPTGAAVGNTSDKEMGLFRATEGPIDPDNLKAEDLLPVLRNIYRKRLDIYNDSVNKLQENNPGYTPPEIKYTPQEKKTKNKSDEMVSVVSPDGKSGRIPNSQVDQAIAEGYKLK
jgi:hypothetical protein